MFPQTRCGRVIQRKRCDESSVWGRMMRIVWLCGFSNAEIRERLSTNKNPLEPLFARVVHRSVSPASDSGVWITNGIEEMKSEDSVELHIITPIRDLTKSLQEFEIDRIHYHFFRDENSGLYRKMMRYLFTRNSSLFLKNRKKIREIIDSVNPDIIHVIGAENPYYSLALLDVPANIPTIVQLQALLVSLNGKMKGDEAKSFTYKGELEKQLIQRADYVGTTVQSFIDFIRKNIKQEAVIINTSLAMGQKIDVCVDTKKFTFVHFASGLSTTKATDIAVKAFASVYKKHPEITLDLIGNYTEQFKTELDSIIKENGMEKAVKFEGRLPTHDDVLNQIRKSRYALLPLKTDIIPNTLHEAMANGLPLLTTATENGTPILNEKRESVLISEIGDVEGLAANMIRLLEEPDLAERLRQNAAITESEYANNHDIINHWVEVYKAILMNKNEGIPIPNEFLL